MFAIYVPTADIAQQCEEHASIIAQIMNDLAMEFAEGGDDEDDEDHGDVTLDREWIEEARATISEMGRKFVIAFAKAIGDAS